MIDTNFMSSIAYIAVFEEWYVLTSHGYFDAWPIFQGRGTYEKMEIAKKYLELIIDDVNRAFPGIPTVIVENILPPNNLDIIGIDAYYIPTSPDCDLEQKAIFNAQVMPYYDIGRNYGKPIMMVAPSFVGGPWKMLSECQMQWYADLALNNSYNIESFIWFFYGDVAGMTGVRNYPNLVAYQRNISCQLLGRRYC
jgi:hypothetical protein